MHVEVTTRPRTWGRWESHGFRSCLSVCPWDSEQGGALGLQVRAWLALGLHRKRIASVPAWTLGPGTQLGFRSVLELCFPLAFWLKTLAKTAFV